MGFSESENGLEENDMIVDDLQAIFDRNAAQLKHPRLVMHFEIVLQE